MDVIEGITYLPGCQSILMSSNRDFFGTDDNLSPVPVGKNSVMPWGQDNNLPTKIIKEVESSEILSASLSFNISVAYGLGPKIVKAVRNTSGKVVDYIPIERGREYDFFERNDLSMFLQSMLTDMIYFHNAFAEIIPDENFNEIVTLRHKEAAFSRWEKMDPYGVINHHFYAADWTKPGDDIIKTYVVDEFDAVNDITQKLLGRTANASRMIFPSYIPSPGRPYYSVPGWHSIFNSGWYDHIKAIPELKKAIMKNNLGVKFIVYISDEYWKNLMKLEGIAPTDAKGIKELKEREKKSFQEFLSGENNAAKAVIALKDLFPQGNGMGESKQIEIIPVENDFKGGEYISDLETGSAMLSYATNVHPSLIGATLSKSSGSMSGTDKRELFLIKQALMKSVQDRVMRIIRAIKAVNKWDKDITVIVPEYIFTTQDQNKSGKQESTTTTL